MGSCSWLATLLDQEMLEVVRGVSIYSRTTTDKKMKSLSGTQVAQQLGGRYLLRYLLPNRVSKVTDWKKNGSNDPHWVTPTAYAPGETVSWLALPAPAQSRQFVMLLDPAKITRDILGPRWIRMGKGIEYKLPNGLNWQAVVFAWALQVS